MKKCPRCGEKTLHPKAQDVFNAVSRRDSKQAVKVCPGCGNDEAIFDYAMASKGQELSPEIRLAALARESAWLTLGKSFPEIYGEPYVPLVERSSVK